MSLVRGFGFSEDIRATISCTSFLPCWWVCGSESVLGDLVWEGFVLIEWVPSVGRFLYGDGVWQEFDRCCVVFQGILEGIRKGEIVSSGAVHNSAPKDGSLNRVMRQDSLGRGRGRGRGAGMFCVNECFEGSGTVAAVLALWGDWMALHAPGSWSCWSAVNLVLSV